MPGIRPKHIRILLNIINQGLPVVLTVNVFVDMSATNEGTEPIQRIQIFFDGQAVQKLGMIYSLLRNFVSVSQAPSSSVRLLI